MDKGSTCELTVEHGFQILHSGDTSLIDEEVKGFTSAIDDQQLTTQSARDVDYVDCISAEGKEPHLNKYRGYDAKLTDGEVPVQELLVIWSTPSLPLLSGPLWPGVLEPARVPSMDQIELFNYLNVCKQMTDELLILHSNTWNHLTVCKQVRSGLSKILPTNSSFTNHI